MSENSNPLAKRWIFIPVGVLFIALGLRQMGFGLEQLGLSEETFAENEDTYTMPIPPRSPFTMVDSNAFNADKPMGDVNLPGQWNHTSNTAWRGTEECGYTSQTHLISTPQDNRAKIEIIDSAARFMWKKGSKEPGMGDDPCLGETHLQNEIVDSVATFMSQHFIPSSRPGYQIDDIEEEPDIVMAAADASTASENTVIKIAWVHISKVTPKRVILETVFVNLRLTPLSVDTDGDFILSQAVVISLAAGEDFFYRIEPLLDEVIQSYQPSAEYQASVGAANFTPQTLETRPHSNNSKET